MTNIFNMNYKLAIITLIGIAYDSILFSITGLTTTYVLDNYVFGTYDTKVELSRC